jgi:hypothetical protein
MATGTGLATFLLPELSSRDSLLDRRILARAVLSKDSDISFEQVNLAEVYDALIYVDEVRPTRPLIGTESPEREGPAAACDIRSLCFE